MKPCGPGLLFWGRFLITVSIAVFVIGLFIISVSSWFSLGRLIFSKYLSISSRLSVLLAYRTALAESHGFWFLVFSLSFVSRNLLISFFFSSVTSLLFSNVLFNIQEFVFFCYIFPVVDI